MHGYDLMNQFHLNRLSILMHMVPFCNLSSFNPHFTYGLQLNSLVFWLQDKSSKENEWIEKVF